MNDARLRLLAIIATVVYALHTLAVMVLIYVAIFSTINILPPDPKGRRAASLGFWLTMVEVIGFIGLIVLWEKVGERAKARAKADAGKA